MLYIVFLLRSKQPKFLLTLTTVHYKYAKNARGLTSVASDKLSVFLKKVARKHNHSVSSSHKIMWLQTANGGMKQSVKLKRCWRCAACIRDPYKKRPHQGSQSVWQNYQVVPVMEPANSQMPRPRTSEPGVELMILRTWSLLSFTASILLALPAYWGGKRSRR